MWGHTCTLVTVAVPNCFCVSVTVLCRPTLLACMWPRFIIDNKLLPQISSAILLHANLLAPDHIAPPPSTRCRYRDAAKQRIITCRFICLHIFGSWSLCSSSAYFPILVVVRAQLIHINMSNLACTLALARSYTNLNPHTFNPFVQPPILSTVGIQCSG